MYAWHLVYTIGEALAEGGPRVYIVRMRPLAWALCAALSAPASATNIRTNAGSNAGGSGAAAGAVNPVQGVSLLLNDLMAPAPALSGLEVPGAGLSALDAANAPAMAPAPAAAPLALPAPAIAIPEAEREKMRVLTEYARRQSVSVASEGEQPLPEGPRGRLQALEAFREVFGQTPVAELRRLSAEPSGELAARMARMWDLAQRSGDDAAASVAGGSGRAAASGLGRGLSESELRASELLAPMNDAGFANLPRGLLMSLEEEAATAAAVTRYFNTRPLGEPAAETRVYNNSLVVYNHVRQGAEEDRWLPETPPEEFKDKPAEFKASSGYAAIRAYFQRAERALNVGLLPGEKVVLLQAEFRETEGGEPGGASPHVDFGYITQTKTFLEVGTIVESGGRVEFIGPDGPKKRAGPVRITGERQVVGAAQGEEGFITANDRERLTGVPGTPHYAPAYKAQRSKPRRIVLIAHWGPAPGNAPRRPAPPPSPARPAEDRPWWKFW